MDKTLLPTADFQFFGKDLERPERMDFVVASHWSMILPAGLPAGAKKRGQSVIKMFIGRIRRQSNSNSAQSTVSYSNLLQIVALKTNPAKLPPIHGYSATLDVQSSPNLKDLGPPEVEPGLPYLDPTTFDVTPVTFDGEHIFIN